MFAMKTRTRFVVFATFLLIIAGLLLPAIAAVMDDESQAVEDHRKAVMEWRQKRHVRLASDSGWLTLVGLEWLREGENRIGSARGNDIRLAAGPDYWGTVFLEQEKIRFVRAAGNSVTVDGAFPAEVLMVPDTEGTPTLVKSGNLSLHVIFRESYALRIKDSQAPVRIQFKGVENFDIHWDWRIDGRFIPGEEGQTIQIANVLGQLNPRPMPGWFEFERDDKIHRLMTLGEEDSESLWIIFADRTTGHETYGAGRFLYSDGMPQNGRLVLDFNKAYNPPCAFNDYSTCPLPPQANRLDLAVTAGEKDFHED
jgi:uncharacterized protein (DUF1684 family)